MLLVSGKGLLHACISSGIINELPTNDLEKNESGPMNQFPENQMQELRNLVDGIDITILGKYTSISGTRYKLGCFFK